jgi:hypothetical protein
MYSIIKIIDRISKHFNFDTVLVVSYQYVFKYFRSRLWCPKIYVPVFYITLTSLCTQFSALFWHPVGFFACKMYLITTRNVFHHRVINKSIACQSVSAWNAGNSLDVSTKLVAYFKTLQALFKMYYVFFSYYNSRVRRQRGPMDLCPNIVCIIYLFVNKPFLNLNLNTYRS